VIRGISSAASGMIQQMDAQDVTANNLANANTIGFKRDSPSFAAVLAQETDQKPDAAAMSLFQSHSANDFSQGPMQETGEPFHLALDGPGFFTVQTPNGPAYTRDGMFTLSSDGTLVSSDGNPVLGNSGPIKLTGREFKVNEQGQILQNGSVVDTLRIVQAPPSALAKNGKSLWTSMTAPLPAAGFKVKQGYLEGSNVNPVREMVSMITGFRAFEASQKAIQSQDETLDKLINDAAKVA
jgi:flagellar basal-body rod protein FlgG